MAFRVHGSVKHTNDTHPFFGLRVEDTMHGVLEAMIAGTNEVNLAAEIWHIGELQEALFKRSR